jgi:hypothetical protein
MSSLSDSGFEIQNKLGTKKKKERTRGITDGSNDSGRNEWKEWFGSEKWKEEKGVRTQRKERLEAKPIHVHLCGHPVPSPSCNTLELSEEERKRMISKSAVVCWLYMY